MAKSQLDIRERILKRKLYRQKIPKIQVTDERRAQMRAAALKRRRKTCAERESLNKLSREEYYQCLIERYHAEIERIREKMRHLPPPSKQTLQQNPAFLQLEIDRLENVIAVTKAIATGTYDESHGLEYLADSLARKYEYYSE